MATVSSESVEAGAWGRGVSCGLALVPVVAQEQEAAAVATAGGEEEEEEVGPGEAGERRSRDFGRRRRALHPHPQLLHLLLPLLLPLSSRSALTCPPSHESGELGNVRLSPEGLSTA